MGGDNALTPYLVVKMEIKMIENRWIDGQEIISVFSALEWVEAFIIDLKSKGLSLNTISFGIKTRLITTHGST